jgi:hypothetical protein
MKAALAIFISKCALRARITTKRSERKESVSKANIFFSERSAEGKNQTNKNSTQQVLFLFV